MVNWRLGVAIAAASLLSACAKPAPLARQECVNPDARLAGLLQQLATARAQACAVDCGPIEREIERMTLVCPGHLPTLFASAVVAYETHRPALAQQQLDVILARPGGHPDAAVLRARIAIEDGNLPFATRLLHQQIRLAPDHAGLHETLGGALYLSGDRAEALRELITAEALGAPKWRVAYHRGLIEEAAGRVDDALRYYRAAVDGNPGWAPAQARLTALQAALPGR